MRRAPIAPIARVQNKATPDRQALLLQSIIQDHNAGARAFVSPQGHPWEADGISRIRGEELGKKGREGNRMSRPTTCLQRDDAFRFPTAKALSHPRFSSSPVLPPYPPKAFVTIGEAKYLESFNKAVSQRERRRCSSTNTLWEWLGSSVGYSTCRRWAKREGRREVKREGRKGREKERGQMMRRNGEVRETVRRNSSTPSSSSVVEESSFRTSLSYSPIPSFPPPLFPPRSSLSADSFAFPPPLSEI